MIKKTKLFIDLIIQKTKFSRYKKKHNIFIAKGSFVHKECNIGRHTRINSASHIGPCSIGSHCAIGGRLVVRSSNHEIKFANMQQKFQKSTVGSSQSVAGLFEKPVSIGNACWIGDSVIVLPNVKIGHGAVIGAGSIVTKDIPPYAIAVGNPARVIRKRFSEETINFFLDVAWWDWSDQKARANLPFFETDFESVSSEQLAQIKKCIR